jgi:hypothetical protein
MVVVTAMGTSGPAVMSGQDSPGLHLFAIVSGTSVGVGCAITLVMDGEAAVVVGCTATIGCSIPAKSSKAAPEMRFILG